MSRRTYSNKGTIGSVANCCDCLEYHESAPSNYNASTTWGREHNRKTGHTVHVERVSLTVYGEN